MAKLSMNIFSGRTGKFIGYMEHTNVIACERLIKAELDIENSVEWFDAETNKPIANYKGKLIFTDSDGFCANIK